MSIMSERKVGSITLTYKLRLYDRHRNWILMTKQIYNQVVWHYYQILMKEASLLEQGNFEVLRILETYSIGTKEMKARKEEPLWKLEVEGVSKIPLYFRRAAINTAIGLARSYYSSFERKQGDNNIPSQAGKVNGSPVFYKGMYRAFTENSIQLKLYNGIKWVWVTYPYHGRSIPKDGVLLSPTLKLEKKAAYLHIPVQMTVTDVRTVSERMKEENWICSVSFPDQDNLAVCTLLNRKGKLLDSYFIYGGRAREAQRRKVVEQLRKSKNSRKRREVLWKEYSNLKGRENGVLYQKLDRINTYYAHQVSRKILEYCKKQKVKLIVVPNYEQSISFFSHAYLSTNSFRWQGRAIIRNLKYKAWKEGILVTTIPPYHIADCCSECGEKIRRYNEGHVANSNYYGGKLFLCPNGHQGNAALNTAKNIGRSFLNYFNKELEIIEIDEVD